MLPTSGESSAHRSSGLTMYNCHRYIRKRLSLWEHWRRKSVSASLREFEGHFQSHINLSSRRPRKRTLLISNTILTVSFNLISTEVRKLILEEMPYSNSAREILRLLRTKAPDSDLQAPLSTIEEAAGSLGVADTLVTSTDAYVTAICFLGSKSLSHVLSQIERCKDRLLSIGAQSELARRQIITSVMDYWQEKPGIGVNVVDKLLNYTILTPISVVLWSLNDQLGKGDALVLSQTFEMVSSTVTKVTNRVRQIVVARNQPGLPGDQVAILDETLSKERDEMGKLFAVIEESLVGVAGGRGDDMVESADQDFQEEVMLRGWGKRWLRVFRRKMAVEETWVQETLSTGVQDVDASRMEKGVNQNGNGNALGDGAGKQTDEDVALDEIL